MTGTVQDYGMPGAIVRVLSQVRPALTEQIPTRVPHTEVIAIADEGEISPRVEGELQVGDRSCPPGTLIVLELGASFGPLIAGAAGALLFETWAGDPRPVPADKEGYYALLKEKGIVRLPNPRFTKPDSAPKQREDGEDLYS